MKRTVRVLIIFATTTLTLGYHSQIQAQAVQWRLIGPGTRGTMRGPAFHPTNPSIFSIGIDMGLHFITRDGGITWNILGKYVTSQYRYGGGTGFRGAPPNVFYPNKIPRISAGGPPR